MALVTTAEVRRERNATAAVLGERNHTRLAVAGVTGVTLLILAGRLIVAGAKPIGIEIGLDPFVVGVVIVAVGTSAPSSQLRSSPGCAVTARSG